MKEAPPSSRPVEEARSGGHGRRMILGGTRMLVPFLVRLYASLEDRIGFCGGSLVTGTHVLTAAHCVESRLASTTMRVGTYQQTIFPDDGDETCSDVVPVTGVQIAPDGPAPSWTATTWPCSRWRWWAWPTGICARLGYARPGRHARSGLAWSLATAVTTVCSLRS